MTAFQTGYSKKSFSCIRFLILSILLLLNASGCASVGSLNRAIKANDLQYVKKYLAEHHYSECWRDQHQSTHCVKGKERPIEIAFETGNEEIITEIITDKDFFYAQRDYGYDLREDMIKISEFISSGHSNNSIIKSIITYMNNSRSFMTYNGYRDYLEYFTQANRNIGKEFGAAADVDAVLKYASSKYASNAPNPEFIKGVLIASGRLNENEIDAINNSDEALNLFNKLVYECQERQRPKKEDIEASVLSKLTKSSSEDPEKIKKTKDYIKEVESKYKEELDSFNRSIGTFSYDNIITFECVMTNINVFDDSMQLPIIYSKNVCDGKHAAEVGISKPSIEDPKYILEHRLPCIDDFNIVKNNYPAVEKYFLERLQEDQNNYSDQAEKNRINALKREQEEQRQIFYMNSPRGKCEASCNREYQRNTDMWKSCMSYCADLRDDIIE